MQFLKGRIGVTEWYRIRSEGIRGLLNEEPLQDKIERGLHGLRMEDREYSWSGGYSITIKRQMELWGEAIVRRWKVWGNVLEERRQENKIWWHYVSSTPGRMFEPALDDDD